ncbi:telomerase reverse transcriptase [Aspergillus flavus]|nr:telomerase reverse transcriptase [Aspergillus flavus]
MGKKRKRPVKDGQAREDLLQFSFQTSTVPGEDSLEQTHPVISIYYRRVVTLRQYLLERIPKSSKSRRGRIASVRSHDPSRAGCSGDQDEELSQLLDTTLVGILKEPTAGSDQERRRELAEFTASPDRSLLASTDTGPPCPQAEIVDYVVSTLFNRNAFSYQRPKHILTHGFERANGLQATTRNDTLACSLRGIVARFPNKNVQSLKRAPWTDILGLLGSSGEDIMTSLLFDCGVFTAIDCRKGIYYQLSGIPLSDLEPMNKLAETQTRNAKIAQTTTSSSSRPVGVDGNPSPKSRAEGGRSDISKPNSVVLFRRRMLYARPAFDAKGQVQFGLSNRHVLNRFPSSDSLLQTVHVMKHIFPRQFGLHNVFTCLPDTRTSTLPVKDYSSREEEIAQSEKRSGSTKIPKRLRGRALQLVQQLQNRHERCSYRELLRYYCPPQRTGPWKLGPADPQSVTSSAELGSSASGPLVTQLRDHHQHVAADHVAKPTPTAPFLPEAQGHAIRTNVMKPKLSLTDYATPASSVSAFCRAVLRSLIPPQFYGIGQHKLNNQHVVFKHVDRFVRMRRFESLSIHEICKGIKITCIPWLEPPAVHDQNSPKNKVSLSDLQKRTEILHEIIYYIFDSILIPLVRANFYVTESQTHRNRLFYFQHDVWRHLTEQPLADLKLSTFEELKSDKAERMLGRRSLPYGTLRLLPKSTGIRPILNLRRRMLVNNKWAGSKGRFFGQSVNSTITPIYGILNYEKMRKQDDLGSCLFSVGDIHLRLKAFKERLLLHYHEAGSLPVFYFVKLDIQSCFDTIPQDKLVRLIEDLVSEEAYHFTRHVEMRPPDEFGSMWPMREARQSKAFRKFVARAAPAARPQHLTEAINNGGTTNRRNTVFVDTTGQKEYDTEDLLDLLHEHVRNNLVKLGRKYFRQRNGIPQGSVLSSILCNLFYAEMEREVLAFLQSDETLLLRLVDDFLLVTSNPDLAKRFLEVMIKGQPAYGVSVNPAKSLVNFAAAVDGTHIPRLVDTSLFPYCGSLIDTRTLEIHKDHDRILEGGDSAAETLANSLTVESARVPGRTLHRKLLTSFKLLMHPMYLDTNHNSLTVVLSTLYANYLTTAMKMYQYMRSLRGRAHPSSEVIIRIVRDTTQLAHRLVQGKRCWGQRDATMESSSPSVCTVQHSQVQYLAAAAFRFVLSRKQTRYTLALRWLELVLKGSRPRSDAKAKRLAQVVQKGNLMYGSWRF